MMTRYVTNTIAGMDIFLMLFGASRRPLDCAGLKSPMMSVVLEVRCRVKCEGGCIPRHVLCLDFV